MKPDNKTVKVNIDDVIKDIEASVEANGITDDEANFKAAQTHNGVIRTISNLPEPMTSAELMSTHYTPVDLTDEMWRLFKHQCRNSEFMTGCIRLTEQNERIARHAIDANQHFDSVIEQED